MKLQLLSSRPEDAAWLMWGKNKLLALKKLSSHVNRFYTPAEGVLVHVFSVAGNEFVRVSGGGGWVTTSTNANRLLFGADGRGTPLSVPDGWTVRTLQGGLIGALAAVISRFRQETVDGQTKYYLDVKATTPPGRTLAGSLELTQAEFNAPNSVQISGLSVHPANTRVFRVRTTGSKHRVMSIGAIAYTSERFDSQTSAFDIYATADCMLIVRLEEQESGFDKPYYTRVMKDQVHELTPQLMRTSVKQEHYVSLAEDNSVVALLEDGVNYESASGGNTSFDATSEAMGLSVGINTQFTDRFFARQEKWTFTPTEGGPDEVLRTEKTVCDVQLTAMFTTATILGGPEDPPVIVFNVRASGIIESLGALFDAERGEYSVLLLRTQTTGLTPAAGYVLGGISSAYANTLEVTAQTTISVETYGALQRTIQTFPGYSVRYSLQLTAYEDHPELPFECKGAFAMYLSTYAGDEFLYATWRVFSESQRQAITDHTIVDLYLPTAQNTCGHAAYYVSTRKVEALPFDASAPTGVETLHSTGVFQDDGFIWFLSPTTPKLYRMRAGQSPQLLPVSTLPSESVGIDGLYVPGFGIPVLTYELSVGPEAEPTAIQLFAVVDGFAPALVGERQFGETIAYTGMPEAANIVHWTAGRGFIFVVGQGDYGGTLQVLKPVDGGYALQAPVLGSFSWTPADKVTDDGLYVPRDSRDEQLRYWRVKEFMQTGNLIRACR